MPKRAMDLHTHVLRATGQPGSAGLGPLYTYSALLGSHLLQEMCKARQQQRVFLPQGLASPGAARH